MADSKSQETQQELFNEFSKEAKKAERFPTLSKTPKPILISTSVEQIILASILVLLAACFIFFLGLLRGKSLAGSASASVATLPVRPSQPVVRTVSPAEPMTRQAPPAPVLQPAPARPAVQSSQPSPTEASAAKPYTIQLVTYKKRELAEKEVDGLRQSGYFATIIPSGEYYQVCVGQYGSMEEAKRDLKLFGAHYKDRFLRRR